MGIFHISAVRPILSHTGEVFRINEYKEFNDYISNSQHLPFSQIYKGLSSIAGVYFFSVNGVPHYIGYSDNLKNRIRISFFKRCFDYENVTIQLILCETPAQAKDNEIHYIRTIQPKWNLIGKKSRIIINSEILPFSFPMEINFMEHFRNKRNEVERSEAKRRNCPDVYQFPTDTDII